MRANVEADASRSCASTHGWDEQPRSRVGRADMFLFFSNRLGCLGSLLISAVATLILLLLLGVL